MSADYNYRMNCGQYVLHDGDQPIGKVMDEVALAIDLETGSILKHGHPELVSKWMEEYRGKLHSVSPEMAAKLVLLMGRIPHDELNRCIQITGYGARLWKMAQEGTLQQEPLA